MFTAYGRRNVEYVRGYIKLRPRQDLVYYLKNIINGVTTMNFNKQDEVEGEIELSFGLDKNDLQGTVMAIYPKTQSKKIKDARYDIELFCEKTVKVGKGLELAVEHMEIRDRLQELGFIKFMETEEQEGNGKSGCSITEVTLSDQPPIRPKKMQDLNTNIKILTAKIKIDTSVTEPGFGRATYERGSDSDKQKDGIYEKVEALSYLSDYMARKLSETLTKQISEKMRTKRQQAYRDIVAKHQEEVSLAKKKMKQAQVDNISDESQRIKAQSKLDSKEEQRRKKKQQKKYVVT
ncbi:hypothetical protein AX774_g690 [Zancudomyces culisetae]|uniref:Uncharacterized protein n=1 Tax=Zancudomyces culisetae TaxID=1213189 RepID=A0A1R1PXR2_ZANCU|nr:hypothetical protein AX774_g690 [Zancudomyces culisetae]|eukprot:OMH85743.1 hypothetical protein AX774_g690 [Zancudomyces culisetae]